MRRLNQAKGPSSRRTPTWSVALAGAALLVSVLLEALLIASPALAIARASVIFRSQRWVDLQVPYSQSSYFDGYRQDCSGFVSMSWALTTSGGTPISLASDTLPSRAVPITKDRLLPGDMIVRPKASGIWGHAVIFGGWSDSAHTKYWCYEQSNSAGGARLRETPYPYWASSGPGFAPYRYIGITEDFTGIVPIEGGDRYETAVAASGAAFADPGQVSAVVLATGQSWPDALGGAALAGAVNGPVLLTRSDSLPGAVRAEIVRLAPSRVLVLGGEAAVSETVLAAVRAAGVPEVERIAGADRYETSAAVARRTAQEVTSAGGTFAGTAYVATGAAFPDALAASPVAAYLSRPVLLVQPSAIPTPTASAIADLSLARVYVLGGSSAVSGSVQTQLAEAVPAVSRIQGSDRYATALAAVAHGVAEGLSRTGAGLATGSDFPDALAGGTAQGLSSPGSVLYLTPPGGLHAGVRDTLRTNRAEVGSVRCYGGTSALSDHVRAEASGALQGW